MLSLAALIVLVATQPTDPLAAANKAFADKDWPRAVELYRSVVQAHPGPGIELGPARALAARGGPGAGGAAGAPEGRAARASSLR